MDEKLINKVYAGLYRATLHHSLAANEYLQASSELKRKIAEGIASGTIVGKNDSERQAAALTLLGNEHAAVDERKALVDKAHLNLTLAQIEVEKIRLLMRYAELQAGMNRER